MRHAIIVGAGFLGTHLGRLLVGAGFQVTFLSRSAPVPPDAHGTGCDWIPCDITNAADLQRIAETLGSTVAVAVHCASTRGGGADAYSSLYLQGTRAILSAFSPHLFCFVSSTSVYAQTDGSWVNEDSPAEPSAETGRVLRCAEDETIAAGGVVVRLAGLYGPGRSIYPQKLLAGTALIDGTGKRWINQIHRDDAAAAISGLIATPDRFRGDIFNVSDGAPMTQRDVYLTVADALSMPPPPSSDAPLPRRRGASNKRVGNQKLRSTGWLPGHVSYTDWLHSPEFRQQFGRSEIPALEEKPLVPGPLRDME